jgi:hypothetical protein
MRFRQFKYRSGVGNLIHLSQLVLSRDP